MRRGRLRVLLGAAPGVGKTFQMLREGRRLAESGTDVVVGVVETHGRAATAAQLEGLAVWPRVSSVHRGVELDEFDVDGLITRHPELALIDELAHTNAPGSRHEKRWQDVEALLDAGIDVITTVNVQHIASLTGVAEHITGVAQRESVPDAVVRGADQIEVVDLAPQSLRDRLAAGLVYPAERVDAALSNYFRLGNLTALRELALLWLADEVDQALRTYRAEHGIDGAWQARERVVVALTGGAEGETLLRRGARIAARSAGGELVAVHVTGQDGLRPAGGAAVPGQLARQRELVESLGGTYHQVVGDDVPATLVEFARSLGATQLVIGASRRSRVRAAITGPGIGASVIRLSGDIDVHMVTHAAAAESGRGRGGRGLPRLTGALSLKRRILGFVVALVGGPLISLVLFSLRADETITSDVLSYQLLVVVVALVGGVWPALFAAVLSGVTLDFLFVEPIFSITIAEPAHATALVLYVVIAALVSWVVDQAARRTRAARRSGAESELLATVAGSVLRGEPAVQALVSRAREAFGLAGVRLVGRGEGEDRIIASDGEPVRGGRGVDAPTATIPVGSPASPDRARLEVWAARPLDASALRLLEVIATQLGVALEHDALERSAQAADALAANDRVRAALLSAVSHDLRRPLAAALAAIGGLRAAGAALTPAQRDELIATAAESLDALATLVTDLLDVSRIQAGVLGVALADVDASGAVLGAIDELGLGPVEVDLALDPAMPVLVADPVLLQRVLVNVLQNAVHHGSIGAAGGGSFGGADGIPDAGGSGTPARVRVTTSSLGDVGEIRIIDHGPGVAPERRDEMFAAFQRLGDTDNAAGLGLGLALSRGFAEGMGGELAPEETPGGGLTMVVRLPVASTRPAITESPAPYDLPMPSDRPAESEARP